MSDLTGKNAGIIWKFLDENGPSSSTKITTVTKLNKSEVQRAIGWLTCEGKLDFEIKGRNETISLR
ncbi:MAG: hypothetical protein DRQ62_13520 [Gammaproteobacteria bacterium]|nr:MAG: hypothetical protein DRQ62_13520 [Gammaproteobacteria bacterium]